MARDVKEHAGDKDGLEKNIAKLHAEADKMIDAAGAALKGKSHDKIMDAVTEATRASPYGAAHVAVIVVVVLVVAFGVALMF